MKKLITNIIDYININSARFFFYNSNLFTYNLFSKYYKKNLANKKCNNEILENSYGKIGVASKKEIDEINKELIDQIKILEIKDDKRIIFKFNDNIKESIKNIINQDLKDFLTNLENFYNVRICLGNSVISRNFHIHNSLDVYSNFYHNDRYTFNYFKIFINLHDVSNQEGPMHIVKKKHSQEFFKKSSYKSRNEYNEKNINLDNIYLNVGKKNEIFFCNTTEVLHKAGIPNKGKFRDMLFLTFLAIPKKLSEQNFFYLHDCGHDIFNNDAKTREYAKPEGLRGILRLYNSFKIAKLNKI